MKRLAGAFLRDFGLAVRLRSHWRPSNLSDLDGSVPSESVGQAAGWGSRPLDEMTSFFSRDARSNPNSAGIAIPEGAAYAGIFTIMLAFLSPLLTERKRELVFFGLLLLVMLQVTYGWGPFYPLRERTAVFESLPTGAWC